VRLSKVHIHSDFRFFSGADNMVMNILNSTEMNSKFQFSLSYNSSLSYRIGLESRLSSEARVKKLPLKLWDPEYAAVWLWNTKSKVKYLAPILYLAGMPVAFLAHLVALTFLLMKESPQILHINNGGYPGALSARAALLAGRIAGIEKVILIVNNLPAARAGLLQKIEHPINRRLIRNAHLVISGSEVTAEELQTAYSLDSATVQVLPNGIDLIGRMSSAIRSSGEEPKRLKKSETIFCAVGILEHRKGHSLLIRAAAELKERIGNELRFHIYIEGTGSLEAKLRDQIADLDVTDIVSLVGEKKDVLQFISQSDVLIHPSIVNEDFPNVILEAMALGKAIIGSNVGGIPEQIDEGESGLIFEAGDLAGLVSSMQTLLANDELVLQMGARSLKKFEENYTSEIAVGRYITLYEKLA
jgi:glycosyltransferase involved in cell wall biosynthesis